MVVMWATAASMIALPAIISSSRALRPKSAGTGRAHLRGLLAAIFVLGRSSLRSPNRLPEPVSRRSKKTNSARPLNLSSSRKGRNAQTCAEPARPIRKQLRQGRKNGRTGATAEQGRPRATTINNLLRSSLAISDLLIRSGKVDPSRSQMRSKRGARCPRLMAEGADAAIAFLGLASRPADCCPGKIDYPELIASSISKLLRRAPARERISIRAPARSSLRHSAYLLTDFDSTRNAICANLANNIRATRLRRGAIWSSPRATRS